MRKHIERPTFYSDVGANAADEYADSYAGYSTFARYYQSRLTAVTEQLTAVSGDALLDVGCGPGMMIDHLFEALPDRFKLTGLDQSHGMIRSAERRLAHAAGVDLVLGPAEEMPLPDAGFDVVLAMGVLEYTDLDGAIAEIARVTRPGGMVLVTMLNPFSPYRLVDWFLYAPALRLAGRLEALLGVPEPRRHGGPRTGIRARTPRALCRALREKGLAPVDVVHYDRTPLVPPLDRLARRLDRRWHADPARTIGRGGRARVTGTAYLVVARRLDEPRGPGRTARAQRWP